LLDNDPKILKMSKGFSGIESGLRLQMGLGDTKKESGNYAGARSVGAETKK
jgi:hypothetical protein